MILQNHHITYKPEKIVRIGMQMHECISRTQHFKATPERLELLMNFHEALVFEIKRMVMELITGEDMRVKRPRFLRRQHNEIRDHATHPRGFQRGQGN